MEHSKIDGRPLTPTFPAGSDHLRFDAADVSWSTSTLKATHAVTDHGLFKLGHGQGDTIDFYSDTEEISGHGYARGGSMASAGNFTLGQVTFNGQMGTAETPEALRKRAKTLDKQAKAARKAERKRKDEDDATKEDRATARETYRAIARNATLRSIDRIEAADRLSGRV